MCLIVFSFRHHPDYPIILAGNRDEFYERPARPAHTWNTQPNIIAGKDLKAGGTWLGVSEKGELAAITNHRNFYNPIEGEKSRGIIIPDFLTSEKPAQERIHQINRESQDYSGFNLIAGSSEELWYVSNVRDKAGTVSPGIHGISNAFLDTPWPKVEQAKAEFRAATRHPVIDPEEVFDLLKSSEPFPQEQLPDTGLSSEMERAVSPAFIKTDSYGTRCSSLLMIDYEGNTTFTERTYDHITGDVRSEQNFEFSTRT